MNEIAGNTPGRTRRRHFGRPLKVAVLGAGMMGRVHILASRRNDAIVVAVSDPDRSRASILAKSLGGEIGVRTIDQILESRDVDIIHVCTPPETHYAICAEALGRGIHVFAEKPVADTYAEVERLLSLAESRRVLLCPAHQFPFQRGVRRVVERLSGLGDIRHLRVEICTAGGTGQPAPVRQKVLLDILPHPLSMSQALIGPAFDEVRWSVINIAPGELLISGATRRISLSFLLSTLARPTGNYTRIFGSGGTATMDLFHGYGFFETGAVSRFTKATRPFTAAARAFGGATSNGVVRALTRETAFPGMTELIGRFYAAVLGNSESPITESEIRAIARGRDAIIALCEPFDLPVSGASATG